MWLKCNTRISWVCQCAQVCGALLMARQTVATYNSSSKLQAQPCTQQLSA